jgi:hypothetical protein
VKDIMMAHYNDLLVMKFKVSELPAISRSKSGGISFGAIWDITSKSTESDVCGDIEGTLKLWLPFHNRSDLHLHDLGGQHSIPVTQRSDGRDQHVVSAQIPPPKTDIFAMFISI